MVVVNGVGARETLLAGESRRQQQRRQKERQGQREGQQSEHTEGQALQSQHKNKFIFTTLAIGAAVIGAIQTGDNVYRMIDAKRQESRYIKGLKKAVTYALDKKAFDPEDNNQALIAIMSAYQHCVRLRTYTTGLWKMLWKKHRNKAHRAAIEEHEEKIDAETLHKKFDTATQVAGAAKAATQILSNNDIDIDLFGDVDASSTESALLSASILAIKAYGQSMADYADEKTRISEKAKEKEIVSFFGRALNHVSVGVSIVCALFDPTGLSLLNVLSIAGTAAEEARMAEERKAWREHYCPSLDRVLMQEEISEALHKAGMPRKTRVKTFHFGELVNNADCEERAKERYCLPEDDDEERHRRRRHHDTPCLWNEEEKRCTPCPILPRGIGITTKEQQAVCETDHLSPNGESCRFVETTHAFGYNQCCAVTKAGTVNKDLCY